jgi:hypothetical protein
MNWLYYLLLVAAGMQLLIAVLNLGLVRIMRWQKDLERMPLIVREVFAVHSLFISITVAAFGILTLRFAETIMLGGDEISQWLAGFIGLFWSVRAMIQWTGYSAGHWRGLPAQTAVHWALFCVYAVFGAIYLTFAF